MTAPDPRSPSAAFSPDGEPGWPQGQPPEPLSPSPGDAPPVQVGIRAVDGNRAALTLLVVQNVVAAVAAGSWLNVGGRSVRIGLGWPLGLSLLLTFAVTVGVGFAFFRPSLNALLRDSRWRTPPSWGLALAIFVLAFLVSRAFALAAALLLPGLGDAAPPFLSRGADLVPLLLAAGILIPLAEEVAFRGLMMRGHERAAGFGVAAVASTLAFSVAHGVPLSIAGILPLAYVLARLVQHTGSLWNAVIVHALNNTVALALGIFLLGKMDLGNQSGELLKLEHLRFPLAGGALLFGVAVLTVLHLWLVPRPDPVERQAPGAWLSLTYLVIVLFGLGAALLTLPAVQLWLSSLRGARF